MTPDIALETVSPQDMDAFKLRLQDAITEYFNERHPDPSYPQEEADDYPGEDGGLFKFEKEIAR